MDVLTTPDECFEELSGYPYKPLRVFCDPSEKLQVSVIDIGSPKERAVVLLHGATGWNYSFRGVIPMLAEAGCRVIAPDLIGFGRSDKPKDGSIHTLENHTRWIEHVCQSLGLSDTLLVAEGEGAVVALSLLAQESPWVAAAAIVNPTLLIEESREAIAAWQAEYKNASELPIADMVQFSTARDMHDNVLAGYEAPFPSEEFQEGPKAFIDMLSQFDVESRRSLWQALGESKTPCQIIYGELDSRTEGSASFCQGRIAGASDREALMFAGAGHLVSEDRGSELALALLDLVHSLHQDA